jgi:hypothetical protein
VNAVFAPSMTRRHGQIAWRMTVLFAMFYDDFLGNMEIRRTWQSFNESHCWCMHRRIPHNLHPQQVLKGARPPALDSLDSFPVSFLVDELQV